MKACRELKGSVTVCCGLRKLATVVSFSTMRQSLSVEMEFSGDRTIPETKAMRTKSDDSLHNSLHFHTTSVRA